MAVFGLGKAGIARAFVNFSEAPDRHPLTVCFHFPNKVLTHAYVLRSLIEQLRNVPGWSLGTLRFEDRNVILGCPGLENRWIIACKNDITCEFLIKKGVMLCNKKVQVQLYDDILAKEYKEYTTYLAHRKVLFADTPRSRQQDQNAIVNQKMALASMLDKDMDGPAGGAEGNQG